MPYKHPKISYGLPADSHNSELTSEYIEDLQMAIGIKENRRIVGVRFFFNKEDYDACPDPQVSGKLAYCVMVKKACEGKSYKSRLQNHNCDGGTTALGLEKSNNSIESGEEYFSYNLYGNRGAARRMRQSVDSLHRLEADTYGILVKPLNEFISAPDVVICLVNPYQAMRIVQGYVYHDGRKPNFNIGGMQALCSEITATPYITGELNLSVLCPSTRMLCRWDDDIMAAGLPFDKFFPTVEGVIATINTTDLKKYKEEIIKRFAARGKELSLTLNEDYSAD